jgi:hypothetical protein
MAAHSTQPVVITPNSVTLDRGRMRDQKSSSIAAGAIVAYACPRQKFNGQLFYTRSTDGGKTFAPPQPITAIQRASFPRWRSIPMDRSSRHGSKPQPRHSQGKGENYAGAGRAFAWSRDHAVSFSDAYRHDGTCECCRIAIAFADVGACPAVLPAFSTRR